MDLPTKTEDTQWHQTTPTKKGILDESMALSVSIEQIPSKLSHNIINRNGYTIGASYIIKEKKKFKDSRDHCEDEEDSFGLEFLRVTSSETPLSTFCVLSVLSNLSPISLSFLSLSVFS